MIRARHFPIEVASLRVASRQLCCICADFLPESSPRTTKKPVTVCRERATRPSSRRGLRPVRCRRGSSPRLCANTSSVEGQPRVRTGSGSNCCGGTTSGFCIDSMGERSIVPRGSRVSRRPRMMSRRSTVGVQGRAVTRSSMPECASSLQPGTSPIVCDKTWRVFSFTICIAIFAPVRRGSNRSSSTTILAATKATGYISPVVEPTLVEDGASSRRCRPVPTTRRRTIGGCGTGLTEQSFAPSSSGVVLWSTRTKKSSSVHPSTV